MSKIEHMKICEQERKTQMTDYEKLKAVLAEIGAEHQVLDENDGDVKFKGRMRIRITSDTFIFRKSTGELIATANLTPLRRANAL